MSFASSDLPPDVITCPGGIEGRGVSSHIRCNGMQRSQRAAFSRAVGMMNATLRRARASACSTNPSMSSKGGFKHEIIRGCRDAS